MSLSVAEIISLEIMSTSLKRDEESLEKLKSRSYLDTEVGAQQYYNLCSAIDSLRKCRESLNAAINDDEFELPQTEDAPPGDVSEMTAAQIGHGVIIYDPDDNPWITQVYRSKLLDLKSLDNSQPSRWGVDISTLKGWRIEEDLSGEILDLLEDHDVAVPGIEGWLTAEIVKKTNMANNPLSVISKVQKGLDKIKEERLLTK